MRFLAVLPYYGTHRNIEKLYESLGVAYPGDEAISRPITITPFAYGDIYLRNNNIENLGYTRACNMGIRYAMKNGYDAIWLLTDDIEVVDIDSAIREFEKELTEHPKTGVIGCKICFKENPDFIYHGGTLQSFPNGLHKSGSVKAGDFAKRSLERWVPGGSTVLSTSCVQDIGVMDENFFNIGSDSDYCFRARLAGYDVVYLPVTVLHPSVSMTSKPNKQQEERLSRDISYFSQKWITGDIFRFLENGYPISKNQKPEISTIISYCSLDSPFIIPLIKEASKFSSEIIISAFDHLLNGDIENLDELLRVRELFPAVKIEISPWSVDKPARYWHNMARWQGYKASTKPWILFLDGDEIPEGDNMRQWIESCDFSHDGYAFRCYWYFRDPAFQSETLSQCGLLCSRNIVREDFIFSESERAEFRNRPEVQVEEGVTLNEQPIFHHFSWARSKDQLLKKVSSWAHKEDRNWTAIIEEEFSRPFTGTEYVHGFTYKKVANIFNIEI